MSFRFNEIVKHESSVFSNFVSEKGLVIDALIQYKREYPDRWKELKKLYIEEYGEDNQWWEKVEE